MVQFHGNITDTMWYRMITCINRLCLSMPFFNTCIVHIYVIRIFMPALPTTAQPFFTIMTSIFYYWCNVGLACWDTEIHQAETAKTGLVLQSVVFYSWKQQRHWAEPCWIHSRVQIYIGQATGWWSGIGSITLSNCADFASRQWLNVVANNRKVVEEMLQNASWCLWYPLSGRMNDFRPAKTIKP